MTFLEWLIWTLLSLLSQLGIQLIVGGLIVAIPIYYHYSLVKAEAKPIIDSLGEDSKLREVLVNVRNTLFTRLLLESNKVYHQLYNKWLSTSGRLSEVLRQTITESTRDPEKLFMIISDLLKGRVYEDEFTGLLRDGKIHIEEEMVESVRKLYNGIRVIDKLFEAYVHALHLRSKYSYWATPLLAFIVISVLVSWIAPGEGYEAIPIASFIAVAYYGYYSQHARYVKEAKKLIFEIKAKTNIGEVLRYVTSRAE